MISIFPSSGVYIPLVAKCAGLAYFHAGRVSGWIIGGVSDSIGLGINLYQVSWILYIESNSSLQFFGVALVVMIRDPGRRNPEWFPCVIGSSL